VHCIISFEQAVKKQELPQQLRKPWRIPRMMPNKALPPCVSHLTPSRRKAFVPKFLSIESFRFGWRCYFAFCFLHER
jgi:hypothetical protein